MLCGRHTAAQQRRVRVRTTMHEDQLHTHALPLHCLSLHADSPVWPRHMSEGQPLQSGRCGERVWHLRAAASSKQPDDTDAHSKRPRRCCGVAGRRRARVMAQEQMGGGGCDRSGRRQRHRASACCAHRRGELGREQSWCLVWLVERSGTAIGAGPSAAVAATERQESTEQSTAGERCLVAQV